MADIHPTASANETSALEPIWKEEIGAIPSSDRNQLILSVPGGLGRIGAVCDGLMKIKLDAIQSILTEGKWLHQTAMNAEEMAAIQEQLQMTEPTEIAEPEPEEIMVVEGDSSLEDMSAKEVSELFREKGFVTVDSLELGEALQEPEVIVITGTGNPPARETPIATGTSASDDELDCYICDEQPDLEKDTDGGHHAQSPPPKATIEEKTSERVVIFAADQDSPWDTMVDEHPLEDTAPPPIKKRRYQARGDGELTPSDSPGLMKALEAAQIRHAILVEGVKIRSPPAWKKKYRGVSLHILHDGLLRNWPGKDSKCTVTEGTGSLKQWGDRIREGRLRLRGHSVIVSLREITELTTEAALKNKVAALVRAIRAARGMVRVYIADSFYTGHTQVLGLPPARHNQLLYQALLNMHISHDMHKVFYVGMAAYFTRPGDDKYMEHTRLSRLGCLHFRSQLFREAGLTGYHQDE